MDGSRIEQAVQRIEAALGRIDAAAEKLGVGPAAESDLAQRHSSLRAEVSSTLAELDHLIEGLET